MSKEFFESRYFSQSEAENKVGKRIQTLVDFSGVPAGNTGIVISADFDGMTRMQDVTRATYDVAIQWDKGSGQGPQDTGLVLPFQKPLVDWFTKEEYERFLVELPLEGEKPESKQQLP